MKDGLRFTITMFSLLFGAVILTMWLGLGGFILWGAIAIVVMNAYNGKDKRR